MQKSVEKKRRVERAASQDPRWPQIEATTLADRVYQIVRNRILQRELAPGTFIREQEVSRATGVSRTPVREALNRLASQDFLERVPHRGFRVPNRPWETLLDVYPIVTALEWLAVKLAFSDLTPADIRRLKELNQKLQAAGREQDAKAQAEYNSAFHQVFSARSGNQRLGEMLDQLRAQVLFLDISYFSVPGNSEQSVAEHEEIIQALENRDFEAAREGLRRNYVRGRRAMEEEITRKSGLRPPSLAGHGHA